MNAFQATRRVYERFLLSRGRLLDVAVGDRFGTLRRDYEHHLRELRGLSLSLRQHHAHVVADFPRLRKRLHSRAGLLSGGEHQMLALARGLMAKLRLLLLDEPSLGLAPAVVNDLFAALDRLQSEQAMSLLVDQMAGLALTLSDRAYVIEAGGSLPPVPWPRSPRRARSNGPISGVVQAESGPPAIFAFPS